jgi:H+/Cl- antiporter ClcA
MKLEEYLRLLRDSLRTPPDETARILAEAEDHLRESVAAGMAAGLTEMEAAEAAISSFGSVQAVVRAHDSSRDRAAAFISALAMATWQVIGIALVVTFAVFLVALVAVLATGQQHGGSPGPSDNPSPLAAFAVLSGPVGVVVLGAYFVVRGLLSRRRRPGRALVSRYAPLARATVLAAGAVSLILLDLCTAPSHHPLRQTALAGLLAVGAAYAIRTYRTAHRQHGTQ